MEISFKKKFLTNLGVTLGIMIILLIVNLFIRSKITETAEQIQKLKRELSLRSQAISSLVILKDESSKAQRYQNFLDNFFPTSDELINFRKDIRSLALKNKLDFNFSFGTESPPRDNGLGFILFQMSISGSPDSFINFLASVENNYHFISFDSIDWSSILNRFNAKLAGKIFIR